MRQLTKILISKLRVKNKFMVLSIQVWRLSEVQLLNSKIWYVCTVAIQFVSILQI